MRSKKAQEAVSAPAAGTGSTGGTGLTAEEFLSAFSFNPAQAAFMACQERFSLYIGGVGAGKTFAGAARSLARALAQPGSLGLIGAPTYPMLRDATQRTFFELLPDTLDRTFQKVEGHLRLENGSEILFRSLDAPDRVRGLNLAWFWLDEAPLAGYYAWQMLKARLRQPGYATAGWATGTPHGRDGLYRDFELAPRPHHALFRAATMDNAAHLPEDYVTDLGLSGALYEQEVLGLFTAFEGLVYRFQSDADGHVRAAAPDQRFASVIGGVDWGYTNPTAAVVFGLDGDDRAWQLAEFYRRRAPLDEEVLPALGELTARWGVRTWYCGPDEPEHIAALAVALRKAGLACRAVAADDAVRAGIQTVTRQLALRPDGTRGLYVDPTCSWTIAEYAAYQYPPVAPSSLAPGAGGESLSELPVKANDHLMDSTRYCLHSALQRARAADAYMEAYLGWRPRPPP
jgi:hypothetical protein